MLTVRERLIQRYDRGRRWILVHRALPTREAGILWRLFWDSHHRWWTECDMQPTGEAVSLPVPGSTHRVWVRPGTTDPIVYYDCLIASIYTRAHNEREQVRTIVDAGANVGMATIAFLVAYPNARVLAIEPDPLNAAQFRENVKPFRHRVEVIEGALVAHHVHLALATAGRGTWAAHVEPDESGSLPTITPEECITRMGGQIDLMKIDIEGAEVPLFAADRWHWLKHVQRLVIEPEHSRSRTMVRLAALAHGFEERYTAGDVVGYSR